jgi:hypothetical protein
MARNARTPRIPVAAAAVGAGAATIAAAVSVALAVAVSVALGVAALGVAVAPSVRRAARDRATRPGAAARRSERAARATERERHRQLRQMRHSVVIRSVHNARVPMPTPAKRDALALLRNTSTSPLQQWRNQAPFAATVSTPPSDCAPGSSS